jgi:CDP-glucose 4,6-dehydratase
VGERQSILEALVMLGVYRGKTVLVTGDTGFKGSWLAIWLQRLGANVVGFALPAKRPSNFVACGLADRFVHVDGDVRDHTQIARVVRAHRPDFIFHLAGQALVLDSYDEPRETFATNVMGTVNLLDVVRHEPCVRSIICVTSDKCYENQDRDHAYHEGDALGGHDPYSASKAAAEIAAAGMRRSFFKHGPGVATARAGNVIGGGDWARYRIIPDCVRALTTGEVIAVRNPHAVRPFQFVLDALHGYLLLGARLVGDPAFAAAWNFGPPAGELTSVLQLVEATIAAWGAGSYRVDVDPAPKIETRRLQLDSEKASALLGWRQVLSLQSAIEMTIEGYRAEEGDAYAHRVDQIRAFEDALRA